MPVTDDQLKEVALHSGVFEVEEDFLDAEFRKKREEIIPYPEKVESSDCKDAFLHLKEKFLENIMDNLFLDICRFLANFNINNIQLAVAGLTLCIGNKFVKVK